MHISCLLQTFDLGKSVPDEFYHGYERSQSYSTHDYSDAQGSLYILQLRSFFLLTSDGKGLYSGNFVLRAILNSGDPVAVSLFC